MKYIVDVPGGLPREGCLAQAVPVVYCRDCYQLCGSKGDWGCAMTSTKLEDEDVDISFCSWGEKKCQK